MLPNDRKQMLIGKVLQLVEDEVQDVEKLVVGVRHILAQDSKEHQIA
jgi:hypothetical protein